MEPFFNRSNSMNTVISLLIDAGGIGTSAFLLSRTVSVARSIT